MTGVVFDTNFFILLLDPGAMPHVARGRERVEFLISELSKNGETIIIPAPVVAEIMVGRVDRAPEILALFQRQRAFQIQDFDFVIAIEAGKLVDAARQRSPRAERPEGWRSQVKYDAMIAATAIVRRARAICTGDGDFDALLVGKDVEILRLRDLPLPPAPPQHDLPFSD